MIIQPYKKNAKKHPDVQLRAIARSIKRFGFLQPIVVDDSGTIVVGHGRDLGAKVLGFEELREAAKASKGETFIPYQKADTLTKDEINAYRLADNKLNETDWDTELLAEALKEIPDDLLGDTGFNEEEVAEALGKAITGEEDDFDITPPVEPKTKLGDLYALGEHRLLCGDATKREDVERLMGGEKADMVFTDPPYGVSYVGKTKDAMTIENDELEDDGSLLSFLQASLGNVVEVLKEGGPMYVAAPPGPLFQTFGEVLKGLGVWRQTLNWVKNSLVMGRSDYHYRHEPIFYGWKEGAVHVWSGDRTQDTVWEKEPTDTELLKWAKQQFDKSDCWKIKRPSKSIEHPTMKPIKLIVRALQNSSKIGDLILDSFLGSGSTLIASEQTGRKCYGLEISPAYCDVIIARWEKLTGKNASLIS